MSSFPLFFHNNIISIICDVAVSGDGEVRDLGDEVRRLGRAED